MVKGGYLLGQTTEYRLSEPGQVSLNLVIAPV
jgi:hypothetical protein